MYDKMSESLQGMALAQPCVQIPFRDRIAQQKDAAVAEVNRLTELLDLLDKNPETQRILELIGRAY